MMLLTPISIWKCHKYQETTFIPCILPSYWHILRYKNSKNEEIWEIQEDQRRYMFIFWLLFRLVGISSISETGLFYVWIRSNILKRILHQIGQTSSFLIIDTVDPMKDNTTVHRGLSHTVSAKTTVQNHNEGDCYPKRSSRKTDCDFFVRFHFRWLKAWHYRCGDESSNSHPDSVIFIFLKWNSSWPWKAMTWNFYKRPFVLFLFANFRVPLVTPSKHKTVGTGPTASLSQKTNSRNWKTE